MPSYYATVEVDGEEKGLYVSAGNYEEAFFSAESDVFFHEHSAVNVIVKAVELVR